MSDYKMNQEDLRSYFKSLCNSFYIAYDKVKRLRKEKNQLNDSYYENDLETVNSLLELESWVTVPNKYVTLKYSRKELEKEKERLEAEEQEYERKYEELRKILRYWSKNMWSDYEAIKSVLYEIKDNEFSIIITTKAEVYALMHFYNEHLVEDYPVVNIKQEYRTAFPSGEEIYEDFLKAYDFDYWADAKGVEDGAMKELYEKYF